MSNLYIIGNGFDLAHNLETDYWAFRKFLKKYYIDFLILFEKIYNINQLDPTEYGYNPNIQEKWNDVIYNMLWSSFEEFIGFPNIQEILDDSSSILDDMNLDAGNIYIKDTMDEYWKKKYGFISDLHKYVNEWILTVNLNNTSPKKISLIQSNDYFLSFNYTTLLEDVYKIENVMHIHGCVRKDINYPPVIGHCNQQLINEHIYYVKKNKKLDNDGEMSIHTAIVNYLSSIYKDTKCYINANKRFFNHLKEIEKVIIFGWSAGEVDIPYLDMIQLSVSKNVKWEVYYYNQKSYNLLYQAFKKTRIYDNFKDIVFIKSEKFWDY